MALSYTPAAYAQSAANVAVVVNEESEDSRRIAEHYIRVRQIPDSNVIRIRTTPAETITREQYLARIEGPIRRALSLGNLQDRILYLVLTKGVPLRIEGTPGLEGTVASVDSELTLLYRRMTGRDTSVRGRLPNPYFLGATPLASAQQFSHRQHDLYLVTRLDGFSVEDVLALIDRAQQATNHGRFVLDQRAGVYTNPAGDTWLAEANRRLSELGLGEAVVFDRSREAVRDVEDVLGYYTWGSNDPEHRVRQPGVRFAPGALAATFAGADARTFEAPPPDWQPTGDWDDKATWFQDAPSSLIGDLIKEGVTGAAGHVADPFLQSTIRPEILFPAYASGFTLAEAYYLAMPHVSWQTVVIGDPLCRPFAREPLTAAAIEDPLDPETELPGLFSKRRLELLGAVFKDAPPKALALFARAEGRLARDDMAGARQALEEGTALAPNAAAAQLQLALLYERDREYERARERYEKILEVDPNNAITLNNLAYLLAVHANAPADAKPLAEKATRLGHGNATMTDTLAWIEHLLGNNRTAARLIATAVRGAPDNAEIRLHAAFIYAAIDDLDAARTELDAALAGDATLAERPDVQALQKRLSLSPSW